MRYVIKYEDCKGKFHMKCYICNYGLNFMDFIFVFVSIPKFLSLQRSCVRGQSPRNARRVITREVRVWRRKFSNVKILRPDLSIFRPDGDQLRKMPPLGVIPVLC